MFSAKKTELKFLHSDVEDSLPVITKCFIAVVNAMGGTTRFRGKLLFHIGLGVFRQI